MTAEAELPQKRQVFSKTVTPFSCHFNSFFNSFNDHQWNLCVPSAIVDSEFNRFPVFFYLTNCQLRINLYVKLLNDRSKEGEIPIMKRIGIGCGVIILIAVIAAIALPDKSEKSGKKAVASEKAKTEAKAETKAKTAPAKTEKEKTEKAPVTSDSGSRPKTPPKRTADHEKQNVECS